MPLTGKKLPFPEITSRLSARIPIVVLLVGRLGD